MLVLTRRPGQTITIQPGLGVDLTAPLGALFTHGPIEVRVNHVERGQVNMGITAHTSLTILRDEISLSLQPRPSPFAEKPGISPSHERLARNVFTLRRQYQWSVKQLAEASTMSISRLCDIEAGRCEMSLTDLDRLAMAFGTDIAELFRIE